MNRKRGSGSEVAYSTRLLLAAAVLAAAAAGTGCSACAPRGEPQATSQTSASITYACNCYNRTDPHTGVPGRLFVNQSNESFVLYEDPATHDAYRWDGTDTNWTRIGGSARGYAAAKDASNNDILYRLAGDARIDVKLRTTDEFAPGGNWTRVTSTVARDLFVSANVYYGFGPIYTSSSLTYNTEMYGLFRNFGASNAEQLDTVSGSSEISATAYAEGTATNAVLYKKTSTDVQIYTGSGWSPIADTAVNAIYSAGGTVFAQTPSGTIQMYTGTPFAWSTPSGATGITKVTGNATSAYALAGGSVYQLSGTAWTIVPDLDSVFDISAGPANLYAVKADGSIWQLGTSLTEISCTNPVSATNCVGTGTTQGCEPGPVPTAVEPAYSDQAKHTQSDSANTKYDVLMQHNDPARTGAALAEDVLTPSSLSSGNFGYLGSVAIPGKVYAQPLYVENAAVMCPTLTNKNIAYVATLENAVVAIDVDARQVCWTTPVLGCPQPADAAGCQSSTTIDGACSGNFDMVYPNGHREGGSPGVRVGIVSTPVIDLPNDVMYVMDRERDGDDTRGRYFLDVLDIRTGQLVSRVEATADALDSRTGCGHDATTQHAFHPSNGTNRAGLLLNNDILYAAFSSNASENSNSDYHGHVLAFDVSNRANPLNLSTSFCATPDDSGGGIWMAGGGIASDGVSAFFTTGNGAYPQAANPKCGPKDANVIHDSPTLGNYQDGMVKLGPDMTGTGYVDVSTYDSTTTGPVISGCPTGNLVCSSDGETCTSANGPHSIFWGRENSDADLGSGGVLLLPYCVPAAGSTSCSSGSSCDRSSTRCSLIGGGKDGRLYALDTLTMAPFMTPQNRPEFAPFVNTYQPSSDTAYNLDYYYGPHIHGGPVAYDPNPTGADIYVYAWAEKDHLKRFRYNRNTGAFESADAVDATAAKPFPTAHGDLSSPAAPEYVLGTSVITPGAMPGGMLSISANGVGNVNSAIVWATVPEPYKFCTKVQQPDGSWKVLTDQPLPALNSAGGTGDELAGCDIQGGYVPGRLYAFGAEADGSNRLPLLWGDTVAPPVAVCSPPSSTPPSSTPPPTKSCVHDSDCPQGETCSVTTQLPVGADPAPNNYIAAYAKQTSPTIAHGKVLIATANNELRIYGLGSTHLPQPRSGATAFHDLALTAAVTPSTTTPAPGFTSLPVAGSTTTGGFTISAGAQSTFEQWASTCALRWDNAYTHALAFSGDFNGDGKSDIVLTGAANFTLLKLALSTGNGSFQVQQWTPSNSGFNGWATAATTSTPTANVIVGRFGDGAGGNDAMDDIALVGDPGFCGIPVAFSQPGSQSFTITNTSIPNFGYTGSCSSSPGGWAAVASARLAGDFDGDGRTDIALLAAAGSGWHTIPVAFSNGDGSFRITNVDVGPTPSTSPPSIPLPVWPPHNTSDTTSDTTHPSAQFALWATSTAASKLVGDFNGDGRADIVLFGDPNWITIPIAFSSGDGSFRITNRCASTVSTPTSPCPTSEVTINFAGEAASAPAQYRVVGDFNGDGRADLAILEPSNSASPILVAFSNGDGSFRFARSSAMPSLSNALTSGNSWQPVVGDFDHDGSADIALVAVSTSAMPVAFSNGDGTFRDIRVPLSSTATPFQADAAVNGSCGGVATTASVLLGNFQ